MVELRMNPFLSNAPLQILPAYTLEGVSFAYNNEACEQLEGRDFLSACNNSEGYNLQQSDLIFSNLSCVLYQQVFYALTGESGLGKTSFLRLLLGLEEPLQGTVVCDRSLSVGVLFQENCLLEDLSIAKNLLWVQASEVKKNRHEFLRTAENLLRAFKLDKDLHTPAKELSGGQKRRLALARTLLVPCDVLVLDEPLRGVDNSTKEDILPVIQKLLDGKTVLWVSHDKDELEYFRTKNTQFQEISFSRSDI